MQKSEKEKLVARLRRAADAQRRAHSGNLYHEGIAQGLDDAAGILGKVRCEEEPCWIPLTTRPMDEEERLEWSEKLGYDIEYEDAVIYTSQLPDDGQEVLTCNRYGHIAKDKFENDPDYGCCFEENGDMDGIVAWMPLPKPYEERREGDGKAD